MFARRAVLRSSAAAIALSLTWSAPAQADAPTPVVATFSILGDMIARVGGEHVEVTSLVGPNGDTHFYRPTPADARAVNEAQVLIVNGLEFEGWLDRLIDASDFDGVQVVATQGVDAIAYDDDDDHDDHGHDDDDHDDHGHKDHDHDDHGHDDHGHDDDDHGDHDHDDHAHKDHDHDDHGHDDHDHDDHAHKDHDHDDHGHDDHGHDDHGHDDHGHDDDDHGDHDHDDHGHAEGGHHDHHHGEFDPHAWQSLKQATVYVTNIAAALAKADPENAEAIMANRDAYIAEINALDAEIRDVLDAIAEGDRIVVTSHDAFQYFGRDYGLTFLAPQGLSTEAEASAKDVAALIEQIRDKNIKAVFVESITDSRLLERIAAETGAAIGGTLYPGALSEADGPAPTYLEMMRHNAKTLAAALGS